MDGKTCYSKSELTLITIVYFLWLGNDSCDNAYCPFEKFHNELICSWLQ